MLVKLFSNLKIKILTQFLFLKLLKLKTRLFHFWEAKNDRTQLKRKLCSCLNTVDAGAEVKSSDEHLKIELQTPKFNTDLARTHNREKVRRFGFDSNRRRLAGWKKNCPFTTLIKFYSTWKDSCLMKWILSSSKIKHVLVNLQTLVALSC